MFYHSLKLLSGYFSPCLNSCLFVDDRFPPDATVEFIFSNGPEKMKGESDLSDSASSGAFCTHILCAQSQKLHLLRLSSFPGQEYRTNDPSIKVDYNTSDPVIRWDSYENFNLHHQDSLESKKNTFVGI